MTAKDLCKQIFFSPAKFCRGGHAKFLTRNHPCPNCLLKCLPNCLEDMFSSSKLPPRWGWLRDNCRETSFVSRQFCPATSRCLFLAHWAPSSVSFLVLAEFQRENSVRSSQPLICVPKQTHRVFLQNSPEFVAELSEVVEDSPNHSSKTEKRIN